MVNVGILATTSYYDELKNSRNFKNVCYSTLNMSGITLEQYAAMNASQRQKVNKPDLLSLLNAQIGQPMMIPEDTLRNIIKDTIDRSIDEKIPNDLGKTIEAMKRDYDEKIDKLENENKLLKKSIMEQQKFLEGAQREKTKNNVFIGVRT